MRRKNPLTTIYHSDAPNRLKGYKRYKNTRFARLYNYAPILHDAWEFLDAVKKQMTDLFGDMNDLPEDFRGMFEEDLDIMIKYLRQWQVNNLHNCECGNGSKKTGKTHCSKCFLGKTGWRLKEYVNTSMDTL